jgi:MFS family permease
LTPTDPQQPTPPQSAPKPPRELDFLGLSDSPETAAIIPTSSADVRRLLDPDGDVTSLPADIPDTIEMVAFQGRPARKISLKKAAPFGWAAAIVLALTSFMDRIEQSILAGVLPDLKDDFGLLNTGAGIAGTLLLFLSARLAVQVNRTKTLGLILLSWSLLSFATGVATGFAMLLGVRILLGAAGAFNNPLANSLLGDRYPRAGRSRAYGLERFAYFIANPVGVAGGAAIAAAFGWRAAFYFLVIPGVVVAGLVFLLKEPVRGLSDRLDAIKQGKNPAIVVRSQEEAAEAELEKFTLFSRQIWDDFKAVLRVRTIQVVLLSQGVLLFGLGGILFFTTTYLTEQFGASLETAGSIAGAVGGTGILIGIVLGITLGDRFVSRVNGWRIVLASIGLTVGVVGVTLYALSPALVGATVGFFILNVGFASSLPSIAAAIADLSPSHLRGQAFALFQLVVGLASALGPLLLGIAADLAGGSFRLAFLLCVPPLFIAVFLNLRARSTYVQDEQRVIDSAIGSGPDAQSQPA